MTNKFNKEAVTKFCYGAGIKKKDLINMIGLSDSSRFYVESTYARKYYNNSFQFIVDHQEKTQLTGDDFINHINQIINK